MNAGQEKWVLNNNTILLFGLGALFGLCSVAVGFHLVDGRNSAKTFQERVEALETHAQACGCSEKK